jgi:penicillin amidase
LLALQLLDAPAHVLQTPLGNSIDVAAGAHAAADAEQVADIVEREPRRQGALDEAQAVEVFLSIGDPFVATRTQRSGQQAQAFIGADAIHVDAGRLREVGDRGEGNGWHGAGVAFGVTIESVVPDRDTAIILPASASVVNLGFGNGGKTGSLARRMDWHMALNALRFAAWLGLGPPRPPKPQSVGLAERLAALPIHEAPLQHEAVVRWNDHAMPFIEAQHDDDLPVLIGMVQAHLRLGQMEVFRRVSAGRMSEMVGAAALELDRTVRIIGFAGAVPEMVRMLPPATRNWVEGYVRGVNHMLGKAPLPLEFRLFALEREPWTVADVLTLGRLYAFDNSWLVWRRLLGAYGGPGWEGLWDRIAAHTESPPDEGMLGINNRGGSNAVAIAAARGGKPWIAADPHLGLSLPNNWLIMGYRAPSHRAVGLMIPGTPFIAIGRNDWIGWAGTSLHAHVSELCDVSDLPKEQIEVRHETIRVRWGTPRTIDVRACAAGPILSDSRLFRAANRRTLALRWVGHAPSDEMTAMLEVERARDWTGFRAALQGFAVPGLNMLYADAAGHVGHALAAWIPMELQAGDLIASCAAPWTGFVKSDALPSWFDPKSGFVVSANDRPRSERIIGRFFSPSGRADRLAALVERMRRPDLTALAELQQDVRSTSAQRLAHLFGEAARVSGELSSFLERCIARLEAWDGGYEATSKAAALFERLLFHFAREFYRDQVLAAYGASWAMRDLILHDLEAMPSAQLAPLVREALQRSVRQIGNAAWGDWHRLRLDHPLGGVPVAGRHYRFLDLPAAGGSDTVMKTSNPLVKGRHAVRFGSNARFVADLSDLDENHAVLLGGQDGWFGSTNFLDQVELWRRGAYVRLPLKEESVRREFPLVTTFMPASSG